MKDTNTNQQLVDDLKMVLDQAEELLESTTEASGGGISKAREKLTASVDLLREQGRRVSDQAAEAARASGRIVRKHPYGTAGGGLAVLAALIGMVWLLQRAR